VQEIEAEGLLGVHPARDGVCPFFRFCQLRRTYSAQLQKQKKTEDVISC